MRLAYLAATLLVVIAPGPDNLLAISRGLSQGPLAGALSSLGAGLGIMAHTLAATLGLALVLQTSPLVFLAVKVLGAAYLLWLGYKAIVARDLVTFVPAQQQPPRAGRRERADAELRGDLRTAGRLRLPPLGLAGAAPGGH